MEKAVANKRLSRQDGKASALRSNPFEAEQRRRDVGVERSVPDALGSCDFVYVRKSGFDDCSIR